jgi:hypothetical protein
MQRMIGRVLISLAVLATAVIPIRSDGNDSHVFSPQWSPHACFHGIMSIGVPVLLAPVALWLLWRRSVDPDTAATVAAFIEAIQNQVLTFYPITKCNLNIR